MVKEEFRARMRKIFDAEIECGNGPFGLGVVGRRWWHVRTMSERCSGLYATTVVARYPNLE